VKLTIGGCGMKPIAGVSACALVLALALPASSADDSKVKAATQEVESGAKKIGAGKIGQGVEETAKGIGKTIVEGAKFTGATLKEGGEGASKAAEPKAKSAWGQVRDGAVTFGQGVKSFFSRLFGN
jgi:hypothetical protein